MSDQSFIALRSLLTDQAGGGGFVRLSRAWYRAVGGHRDAALLIDELLFRADVSGADADGWFHVPDAELADKLCCGVKAVAAGREHLVAAGWIEARRDGVPARMFYRINPDAVTARFAALAAELVMPSGRTGNAPGPDQSRPEAEHSIKRVKKPVKPPPAGPAGDGAAAAAAPKPATFTDLLLAHLEESVGSSLRARGSVKPTGPVGATIGALGRATGDDVAAACALWTDFVTDKGQHLRASYGWPEQFGVWLKTRGSARRPGGASRSGPVAPASAEDVARARAAHQAMQRRSA